MIVERTRLHLRASRRRVLRAGVIAALAASTISLAQDNNPGGCVVNEKSGDDSCSEAGASLDWVPIDQVPEALRDAQCRNCSGRYLDPLAGVSTAEPPERAQINARADSSDLQGNQAVFDGRVQAQQGYRRLYGDNAVVFRDRESAVLTGNVTLREPGVLLTGGEAEVFSETGEATVKDASFVFHEQHMRGAADLLRRDADGFVHIQDGSFSYCAPGEKDWMVHAEHLKLDLDEGLATANDATIEFEGVPVFYSPWLQFPIDDRRRTGVLWPDFGNDSSGGLDITVPVYVNLAPNYDALYSPRYIEERGFNQELMLRYLSPRTGQWSVGGAWMHDDDKYADREEVTGGSDRWLGVIKQDGLFRQRWRSKVDYSKASDVDYMKDLETTSLESQRKTSLLQLAALDYLGDNWLFNLEARQFQSLADDINKDYQTLPQLSASYWGRGQPFELEPVIAAQLSNFDSDEQRVTGQRLYAEGGVTYPMRWLAGFLQPTLKYRQLYYELSEGDGFTKDNPSAGATLASLDGGLVLERQTSIGGKLLLQTLEPRLYYLYSENEEQADQPDFDSAELTFTYNQLFRETRFSGRDRLDDANQVAVGLTTNFIDNLDGSSILRASIGQIYYFRDREVRLLPTAEPLDDSGSEIAGELDFTPTSHIRMRTSLVYDPFDERMNSGNFHTSYQADNGGIFNLGYSYRRPLTALSPDQPNTEEASLSAYVPLNNKWSVFGAVNYNTEADRSVEDMVGVEYDSCCWSVRFLYLRYYNNESGALTDFEDPDLERENTLQFQIFLKGMGGFGNRITDIMQDMIRGFDEREY
ncbi:MAG: LPS-assembly protein LptD [Halioglobus sp.]|nr:LPS-assembly protein LptD [Halioglobus sp.]